MRLLLFVIFVVSSIPKNEALTLKKTTRKSLTGMDTTKALLPENTKSNLEMLISLAQMHNSAKLKSEMMLEEEMMTHPSISAISEPIIKERGVLPVTHEEEDPLPLVPVLTSSAAQPSTTPAPAVTSPVYNFKVVTVPSFITVPETKGENLISSTKQQSPTAAALVLKPENNNKNPTLTTGEVGATTLEPQKVQAGMTLSVQPTSMEELLSIKEDQPRPMTNFQNIKDAYFDLLQQFKEFRTQAYKKISKLEQRMEEQLVNGTKSGMMESMTVKMDGMVEKLQEIDLRHNLTRLMDQCVFKIVGEDIDDATVLWHKIEMSVLNPTELETSRILRELVALAYTRNKTNSNPVFSFLRKLQDVDKIPSYEFLLNTMRARDDFNGPEIFYIAQYLKDHNAVRSSLYSRIPKSVQFAISGRNVNIIYYESRTGRNYLHVRDDGNRRERHNFYIKASQSYTESKAAVWRTVYYPATESFRIRNVLFNDYMFVNDEGFLETTPMANANQMGTEFSLELQNNLVVLISKHFNKEPLVATWSGGRFPFYFSLRRDASMKHVANFIIEPDTLL